MTYFESILVRGGGMITCGGHLGVYVGTDMAATPRGWAFIDLATATPELVADTVAEVSKGRSLWPESETPNRNPFFHQCEGIPGFKTPSGLRVESCRRRATLCCRWTESDGERVTQAVCDSHAASLRSSGMADFREKRLSVADILAPNGMVCINDDTPEFRSWYKWQLSQEAI